MKKNDLLSDTGGKRIAVFQNVGLQFGDVLTPQMVYHRKMQAPSFGIMPCTVEGSHPAVNNIFIGARPQVEDSVNRVRQRIVGMAVANQFVRMFLKVLGNHRHNHPPHFLVRRTATLPVGKPEQKVEHAMTAHLRHLNKMKHIKAIRGIVKFHRRIASFP